MPKVQQYSPQVFLDSTPAVRQTSKLSVQAPSNAIGDGLSDIAKVMNKREEQLKKADDAAFVTENANSFLRDEVERLTDAQTRGADVDLGKYKEELDVRVDALSKNAPSEEARNKLKEKADNAFSRKLFPAYSRHQSQLNAEKRLRSFQSGIDDIQSEVLTGRTSVAEGVERVDEALDGLDAIGGVVDKDKIRTDNLNQLAVNSLGGRIDHGEGAHVIEEIKNGQWDDLTDSKTLGRILSAAERDVKQRGLSSKRRYASGFDDYVAYLGSGKEDEELANRFSKENITSAFGKDKAPEILERLDNAKQYGASVAELSMASPEEARDIIEKANPDGAENFRRESREFNSLNQALRNRNKQISDDPSNYVIHNSDIAMKAFQDLSEAADSGDTEAMAGFAKEYTSIQRALQEDLGIPSKSVQLLPKQFEDALIVQLNDKSQGGEKTALLIDSLKSTYGNEWDAVLNQLQQNGELNGGIRVLSGLEFGSSSVNLAEAVAVKQSEYKLVIGPDDFKAIKDNVRLGLSDFQDTLRGQPGGDIAFTQHQEAIESLAMKYIADGAFTSTSDAIERARDDVLDSRFTFVDSYRVPVKFNASKVEDGVHHAINNIKTGGYDLLVPDSSKVINDEDRSEVYLSVLMPKAITDPSGSGIIFVDSKSNAAILLENGDPLIVPWQQLSDDSDGLLDVVPGTKGGQFR